MEVFAHGVDRLLEAQAPHRLDGDLVRAGRHPVHLERAIVLELGPDELAVPHVEGHPAEGQGFAVEGHSAAMVLHNLFHDRQTEASAFRLVGHIRFRQPRAVSVRQPDAVISHGNPHPVVIRLDGEHDLAEMSALARPLTLRPHGNGIGRVLQQIGKRLAEQTPIAGRDRTGFGNFRAPLDLRPRAPLQNQRLARHPPDILRLDHRLRHAREGRELVDHAADIADMADDRVSALREGIRVGGNLLGESPFQPLGGKLNWRQRVFDLVRNPARHVSPSCLPLG